MKRKLKIHQAETIVSRVKLLNELRVKHGYKKISDKRRRRIRSQIRYQLLQLKRALPRMEDVYSPCDPNGWEIVDTSKEDKEKADQLWAMFAAMGMHFNYRKY